MSFWEKFFSLEYIAIPSIISIIFGFFYLFFMNYNNLKPEEFMLVLISLLGFVIGAFIKILFIKDEDSNE